MIYLVTQILWPAVRSQSSSLSLSPISCSLDLGGGGGRNNSNRQDISSGVPTVFSFQSQKFGRFSQERVMSTFPKAVLVFLNQDTKRMYEQWDTDTRTDLCIVQWQRLLIYRDHILSLFVMVGYVLEWDYYHLGTLLFLFYSSSVKTLLLLHRPTC